MGGHPPGARARRGAPLTDHLYAVIPAGGAGSRLWPRSRQHAPKHVLPLSGSGRPLVAEAFERVATLARKVFVLTEERQRTLISELVPELPEDGMIVEPAARGTTNALGLAALTLLERDPDAVMISTAADHVIEPIEAFQEAVRVAAVLAERSDQLVTIGLEPKYPATAFGYIEAGEEVRLGDLVAHQVRRFVEKPDAATARQYVDSAHHFWNLNLFCWRCDVFLEELRQHGPEHHAGLVAAMARRRAGDEAGAAELYKALPVDAVDYTVMERTDSLLLVPATFEWRDVGSWSELADLLRLRQDEDGNVVEGPSVLLDTQSSLISVPDKLVAVIGLSDLVVVDTEDALLICPKARAQDVKRIVESLKRTGRTQYL
jgi:mannose-1-phosphate guanylyltransferase